MGRAHILILAGLVIALAVWGAACGGGTEAVPDEPAVEAVPTLPSGEAIPVEALPDPLPAPYLFRETAAVVEEAQRETTYIVRPGDTLAAVAAAFCVTVEAIQRLNNIVDVNSMGVGDELRIPGSCEAAGAAASGASEDTSGGGGGTPTQAAAGPQRPPGEVYVVEPGDTLADIATAYGFGWRDIADYNGLSDAEADALYVGQELVIPPQSATVEEESAEEERAEPPG